MHTGILWGNMRENDHLGDLDIARRDNIEMSLEEIGRWHGLV